jgi:hypothetical protein
MVRDDAREDREGGDRYGSADEEPEVQERDLLAVHRSVGAVEHGGQPEAEGHRQRGRAQPDSAGGAPAAPQGGVVEVPPDGEHEEEQAHLGDDVQIGPDLHGEEVLGQIAGQQPQQAGTETDPGGDLTDDCRLAQAAREDGEGRSDHEHQSDTTEGGDGYPLRVFSALHAGSPLGRGNREEADIRTAECSRA